MAYKTIVGMSSEQIIEQYGGVIDNQIKCIGVPSNLIEDAWQTGYLAILDSVQSYDDKRSSFSTFIWWKVRNAIFNLVYKTSYSYGRSTKFYYNELKKGNEICTELFDEQAHGGITNDKPLSNDNQTIILFCKKLNRKFDKKTCDILIDYYIYNSTYKTLKGKYGNISKRIKEVNLDDIFGEIRNELQDI